MNFLLILFRSCTEVNQIRNLQDSEACEQRHAQRAWHRSSQNLP